MRIAMMLVSRPNYSTRAMKPFYVPGETWARALEVMKAARRLTPDELDQMPGAVKRTKVEIEPEAIEEYEQNKRGRRGRKRTVEPNTEE